MADDKVVVTLDSFEQRLMVNGLNDFRNDLIRDDKPTEDIDELLLKVIDAPTRKEKKRADREER
jgi:hypothetical protein